MTVKTKTSVNNIARANFLKVWRALADNAGKASGLLLQCFNAACHYMPETADFTGKNADSIKSQKSRIVSVAKTAKVIGSTLALHAVAESAKIQGRQHENVTTVARLIRAIIAERKATTDKFPAIVAEAVKSQVNFRAAQARDAAKTPEQKKAEKSDDKKADDAADKADKVKSQAGFAVMIGNAIEYGRDLPASKTPEEKKATKETIDALVALMLLVQNRAK